jgi:hypothetical protein
MPELDATQLGENDKPRAGTVYTKCTLASWEALVEASEGNAKAFVWPGEGEFTRTGSFAFNAHHRDFQPLLIDRVSASMMRALHDALNEANQARLKTFVAADRGHFGYVWEMTQERVTITGFR